MAACLPQDEVADPQPISPYHGKKYHGVEAHKKIKKAADTFSQICKAPRGGVSGYDPDLWGFSGCIVSHKESNEIFQKKFNFFKESVASFIQHYLIEALGCEGWNDEPRFNDTITNIHCTDSAFSMILELNPHRPYFCRRIDGKPLYQRGNSTLYSASCLLIAQHIDRAINDSIQDLSQLLHVRFNISCSRANSSRLFYVFQGDLNDEPFEFDFVPVINLVGCSYLTIDTAEYKPVYFNASAMSHEIDVLEVSCPGMRHMMDVLNLVLAAGMKTYPGHFDDASFRIFEVATLFFVKTLSTTAWKRFTFADIFKSVIRYVLKQLESGDLLLHADIDDALHRVRKAPDEFRNYFKTWLNIEEDLLYIFLKKCVDE